MWTETIPTKDWDNGEMCFSTAAGCKWDASADPHFLCYSDQIKSSSMTEESPDLDPFKTP